MELSGAQILVQSLIDEGVEYIFGYPGGAVLHLYDALFQQDELKHILVRHEQGATHAADGYARATGKPPENREWYWLPRVQALPML